MTRVHWDTEHYAEAYDSEWHVSAGIPNITLQHMIVNDTCLPGYRISDEVLVILLVSHVLESKMFFIIR